MSLNTTQPLSNQLLPENTLLVGEKDYSKAIAMILSQAKQSLLIFDQNCKRGDFASLKTADMLNNFLSQNALAKLTIILQDTQYFENNCPRLYRLLQTYSHKMTVFETNQTAKHAKDCFMIADDKHYVKRIHIDQARFKYALNDKLNCAILRQRFDELQEASQHHLAVTKLGL